MHKELDDCNKYVDRPERVIKLPARIGPWIIDENYRLLNGSGTGYIQFESREVAEKMLGWMFGEKVRFQ